MTETTITMKPERREAIIDFLQTLEIGIADYEACKDNSEILCWPNGFGLRFDPVTNKAIVCGLTQADPMVYEHTDRSGFWANEMLAYIPNVTNGNGEQARLVPRQTALARALVELRGLRAQFNALLEG